MKKPPQTLRPDVAEYSSLVGGIGELLEAARHASARAVNALMTATYWEIGRRIVEFEQHGKQRAQYGEELLLRLSGDLSARFGRGFGEDNLQLFRSLYRTYPLTRIRQALPQIPESLIRESGLSAQLVTSKSKSPIRVFWLKGLAEAFPLSWTHYTRLLRVRNPLARQFYEAEALRGGWSVRQLERQIDTQFYERTALSRNKTAMLAKGSKPRLGDRLTANEELRDPLVLEFFQLIQCSSANTSPRCLMKSVWPPKSPPPAADWKLTPRSAELPREAYGVRPACWRCREASGGPKTGASSTHSRRFAQCGCGFATPCLKCLHEA